MALTDQQKWDTRRFAGYTMVGDLNIDDFSDPAQGFGAGAYQTLQHRLDNLQAPEESTLINVYLANLTSIEAKIPLIADDLDTKKAAVWERNQNQFSDMLALFNYWRRRMCAFLGIPPGPELEALGSSRLPLIRA